MKFGDKTGFFADADKQRRKKEEKNPHTHGVSFCFVFFVPGSPFQGVISFLNTASLAAAMMMPHNN